MSEVSDILGQYLHRVGMDRPKDAAQQFQVTLLRQWCDHLEAVLDDNGIDRGKARDIIRQVIYGGVPGAAEAELRETISEDFRQRLQNAPVVFTGAGGNAASSASGSTTVVSHNHNASVPCGAACPARSPDR